MPRKKNLPIYTLDIETDPFEHGRLPKPFALGFYDGVHYTQSWGDGCVEAMRAKIESMEPGLIYAHNGGRFDLFFVFDWVVGNPMRIINSRIIKAEMKCATGHHEFRDSYAIMPFPLRKAKGKNQKLSLNMSVLEESECWFIATRKKSTARECYKHWITEYLTADCKTLWELVTDFVDQFGPMLTIGSTAMKELKKVHEFGNLDPDEDLDIRGRAPDVRKGIPGRDGYYYGGRVEAMQKGVMQGNWNVYDINSSYPSSMKNTLHPIGPPSSEGTRIIDSTCFISVTGRNEGAFPMRTKNGGIDFNVPYGTFHVTRHEWDAAFELGLFHPERIHRCINFEQRNTFAEFVDMAFSNRIKFAELGELNKSIMWKFVGNSAYGKFSQNPDHYKEYIITESDEDLHDEGWIPDSLEHFERYIVWCRPSRDTSRYNVAIGASITGASRALLLRGIAAGTRVIYTDTDSLICEHLPDNFLHPNELGFWKLEAEANTAAIAGRKMYALFDANGKVVKQANKGVSISASDIVKVCNGESVQTLRDAPSFKLNGAHNFIHREVSMT